MAKEKIEDVSTEKLLKRKKLFIICFGVYIGIFLVISALILYDLIKDGQIEKSTLSGAIPIFATMWIPILFLRETNKELKRRGEK